MSIADLYGDSSDLLEMLSSDRDTINNTIAPCTDSSELKKLLVHIRHEENDGCKDEVTDESQKKLKGNISYTNSLLEKKILTKDINQDGESEILGL